MQLNRHTYLCMILFAVIGVAVLTSCGGSGDTGKPTTRTEKMGDVFIEITENDTFSTDPATQGASPQQCFGYRPTSLNGQKIYTTSDKKMQPALTAMGQQLVNNLHDFLWRRLGTDSAKAELSINNIVIDEKGKVVYYSFHTIGDNRMKLIETASPIIDSLRPVLLSITFEPAEVNGVKVPYLLTKTIE